MDAVTNPLLDFAVHGGTSAGHAGAASGLPRFTAIRPEHVLPALDRQLADSRALLEECLARGEPGTWTNVAQPLEDMKERLARLWSPVSHLNAVVNFLRNDLQPVSNEVPAFAPANEAFVVKVAITPQLDMNMVIWIVAAVVVVVAVIAVVVMRQRKAA